MLHGIGFPSRICRSSRASMARTATRAHSIVLGLGGFFMPSIVPFLPAGEMARDGNALCHLVRGAVA